MAHVDHVPAVVAVSDIAAGRAWYTGLFGREPDNNPMSNLEEGVREVRERGLGTGEIIEPDKGVQLCPIADPDANQIHLVGNFREKY